VRVSAKILAIGACAILANPALAKDNACRGSAHAIQEITTLESHVEIAINTEFNKNPSSVIDHFDKANVKFFDAIPGDASGGREVSKQNFDAHLRNVAKTFFGTVKFSDVQVDACGNIGFVSMLQEFSGKDASGKPFNMMLRVTDGLKKINGEWKIVHEHISFPVDPGTGMALMSAPAAN